MGKQKKIRIDSMSIVAIDKQAEVGWADIWVSYKLKRRKTYIAFTMMGLEDLKGELEINAKCRKKALEDGDIDCAEIFREDIKADKKRMKRFENGEEFVYCNNKDPQFIDIYIGKDYVTRADMESAIVWHMESIGHLKSKANMHWKKPSIFVTAC